jgi:hypothetical protein
MALFGFYVDLCRFYVELNLFWRKFALIWRIEITAYPFGSSEMPERQDCPAFEIWRN